MSPRRSILMLGGSRQQVVAIERAHELGLRTVVCDYLPDNPGRLVADSFHLVSTTDRETVLAVAREERVSGVLAYASDPAAPTAACVAEAMGLPTNPLAAVEALSVKTRFREALHQAGLPCPGSVAIPASATDAEAARLISGLRWPVVVKPTDSSGSKGVTVVRDPVGLPHALEVARVRSRNGILIAEEHVGAAFPHVVGGDVFVVGGEVTFWGLMSCLRDGAHPLVPVGKKTPPGLSATQAANVKGCLQRLVGHLGVAFGELNVEVILGEGDVPYVLELGARAGGNMIPVQLSDASGCDLVAANVLAAMGEDPRVPTWDSCTPGSPAVATVVVHADRAGTFRGIELSAEAEAACYRQVMYVGEGDVVGAMEDAGRALGILFLRFDCEEDMNGLLGDVASHVRAVVG